MSTNTFNSIFVTFRKRIFEATLWEPVNNFFSPKARICAICNQELYLIVALYFYGGGEKPYMSFPMFCWREQKKKKKPFQERNLHGSLGVIWVIINYLEVEKKQWWRSACMKNCNNCKASSLHKIRFLEIVLYNN